MDVHDLYLHGHVARSEQSIPFQLNRPIPAILFIQALKFLHSDYELTSPSNMHGRQPRFRPRHGGGGRPLPAQPQVSLFNDFQNPNIYFQNLSLLSPLNPYIQNPNFSIQNPNFPIQNPAFSPHQFPNQVFHFQSSRPSEVLERIERAVAKARSDLLIAGESVSAWKVSQSALLTLQADSWDSLGFQLQQVPSLHRLIVIEGKVTWKALKCSVCFMKGKLEKEKKNVEF